MAELQYTTHINQFTMFFQCQSYDLRPRSTLFLCLVSHWATIYDPVQPIHNVFKVAEQRSLQPRSTNSQYFWFCWATIQIDQFSVFCQWLSYDLRPRSSHFLCFVSGWAKIYDLINQFAMYLKWLINDLRPRSTNCNISALAELRPRSLNFLCFVRGRATIYDLDKPIYQVF